MCLFVCSWSLSDCWRQLKRGTKSSPPSSSAPSICLWLKVNCWPSLYYHVTFPNNGKAMTERWACGEFPPFFTPQTKRLFSALMPYYSTGDTPIQCILYLSPTSSVTQFTLKTKTVKCALEFPFVSPSPVMDWRWALLLFLAVTVGPFTVTALWSLTERGHFWMWEVEVPDFSVTEKQWGTGHYHFIQNPSKSRSRTK